MSEHPHAEEFPREETAERIGGALAAERRRSRLQGWLVAAGFALIVLGLPTELVMGRTVELVQATAEGRWTGLHLVPAILARALSPWLRPEPAWLLIAAVALGASLVCLLAMARRRGWTGIGPVVVAAVIVSAPVTWLAATTPSAAACGLLGACWLFASLVDDERPGFARRATIAWLGATLLHGWNVWLWPAYAWAIARRRPRAVGLAVLALASWAAILLGAAWLERGPQGMSTLVGQAWRDLLAGGSGGYGPLLAWLGLWPVALAGATPGLLLSLRATSVPAGRRLPPWILAFSLLPLVALGLGGVVDFDVPYTWTIPVAYLGLLELAGARPLRTALLVLPGLLILVCARFVVRVGEEQQTWLFRTASRMREADVLLAWRPLHAHLARERLRLRVIDLSTSRMLSGAELDEYWKAIEHEVIALRSEGRIVALDWSDVPRERLGAGFDRVRAQCGVELGDAPLRSR